MSKENPIVMIIEDEDLLLKAIQKKLGMCGVRPQSCKSGKQALEELKNMTDAHTIPDAIWLDYHLEDMDGLDFMRALQVDENLAHIPIFVVSNSASPDVVNAMLSLGAIKYILKAEHSLEEIVSQIKSFISATK